MFIPITLFVITLLVFFITRMVPGGPFERAMQAAMQTDQKASQTKGAKGVAGLSEDEIESLEEQFGLDKPVLDAYFQWLGVSSKEYFISKAEFGADEGEKLGGALESENQVEIVLRGTGRSAVITKQGDELISAVYKGSEESIIEKGWNVRIESPDDRKARYQRRNQIAKSEGVPDYKPRVVVFKEERSGIVQGDFGRSRLYGDSVISMISSRIPIALYFGVLTAIITYGISLPLGIVKAISHRSALDSITSVLIFVGYSIPGFALGAVLVVWLGARLEVFPLFGLTSIEFESLTPWEKVKDLAHHTVLPLLCYTISGFAYLTMMMKNNLMDQLSSDYVRTAVSRGASFKQAVFKHAFRNSIIPIATSLGGLLTLFVAGSMLIERVFDIQGFGLLQYQAVVERDYEIVMGTLTIASFLVLMGNVVSDFVVALVDPRVKFN